MALYGRFLRLVREAKGKTLRATARALGCSAAFLSDVELSRRGPLSGDMSKVFKMFAVEDMEVE